MWEHFFGNALHLPEQSGTLSGQSFARAGHAQILAGKPAHNHVHWFQVVRPNMPHVFVVNGASKLPTEHLSAERLNFNLPAHLVAGTFKPQIETTNTGKQTPNR